MSDLTMQALLDMQQHIRALAPNPCIEIRESTAATQSQRAKIYPKRKAKNAAHHRRMNNKWIRRYGFTQKPCAYLIDTSWMGGGKVLIVHPVLMEQVRRTIPECRA